MTLCRHLIVYLILILSELLYADICKDWFVQSEIKSNSSSCLSQCNTYPVDMGTFTCHNECEKFCKPKKCIDDVYWKNTIKEGHPNKSDGVSEKVKKWSESEKEDLNKILQILPSQFKS